MSLCRMAIRSTQRINREYGTDFMWSAAHHSGDVLGVRPGGQAYWLDRRTGRLDSAGTDLTSVLKAFPGGVSVPL